MRRASEGPTSSSKRQRTTHRRLGVIETICLKNFMCHDHLKFDFDPHINFIIGQNGSGKSAILTGIILVLGGKSSTTGRYSNIKGFVKTGKQRAYISVTLLNEGEFAYQPDLYGNKIIVEREISVDGASSYKLKSEEGRIISNAKEELTNILNAMDIQINNPVLILTQETSRNFLMSKTGKEEKLYEFFYKGTGLQLLEENYKSVKSSKDEAVNLLVSKEEALPGMRKELDRLKKLKESSSKISELKNELIWAGISEMETILDEVSKAQVENEEKIKASEKQFEACQKKYDEANTQLDKNVKEKTEIDEKIEAERKILSELTTEKEFLADNVRKSEGAVNLHRREERKLIEDLRVIEDSIKENEMQDMNDFEEQKKHCDNEIRKLQGQILETQQCQEQLKKDIDEMSQNHNLLQADVDSLCAEINSFEYKKNSLQKDLQQLNQAIKNRQVLFGDKTPSVLAEIQQRRREFIHLPKGPMGLDIEVRDQKWNDAIEACIKPGYLRSFCCDNAKDSSVLTSILRKYYPNTMPSIIISKYVQTVHDVSQHKTQSQFPTILDMLKIKDPVIANCLIDQLSIENKILIEDIATAQNIMLNQPPRNCYAAFLLNRDEILSNPYRHYAAGNKSSNNLLRTVNESYINSVKQDYKHLSEQIQARKNKIDELQLEMRKCQQNKRENEQKIVRLTAVQSKLERAITDYQQLAQPKNVVEMCDEFKTLQEELAKKTEELRSYEERYADFRNKYKEVHEKMKAQRELVFNIKNHYEELGRNINHFGKRKEILSVQKDDIVTAQRKLETERRRLTVELNNASTSVQVAIDKANKVCSRIVTDRSCNEIRSHLEQMEKVIKESSNCDRAALLQKYSEKLKKLRQAEADLKTIGKYNKKLAWMIDKREKRFKEINKYTQIKLDMEFSVILKGNGYVGRLNFSKPGALRLEASPRQENFEKCGKKKCTSLSGGERSFVTISFLLALWRRIQMPFRILDEYDVFMDSNNRHLSINLLLKKADEMKNVQFIFLSPLDLPELKGGENVKILKMPAPQRIGLTSMENE